MNVVHAPRRFARAPIAALLSVALCLALSLGAWALAVASTATPARKLLVVGDSTVANYRLHEGERLEDVLDAELGGGWVARSSAGPGTRPGDFYLMLTQAELLRFEPDLVVIAFAPSKLTGITPLSRFGPSNEDLRWLPLDEEGRSLYRTLSPELARQAIVEKAGLLILFLDLLEPIWRDRVAWPLKRAEARATDPVLRHARIVEDARKQGREWAENPHVGSYERFTELEDVRDLEFFLGALRRRRVPAVLVLMPQAHTGIAPSAFPPEAQEKLARSYAYTLRWAAEHALAVLDFNAPSERGAFPPERWDDIWHLKSPEAFRHIARGIRAWIASRSLGGLHG